MLKQKQIWQQKILLMQKFMQLTMGLQNFLAQDQLDQFNHVLTQRDQIMEAIDALNALHDFDDLGNANDLDALVDQTLKAGAQILSDLDAGAMASLKETDEVLNLQDESGEDVSLEQYQAMWQQLVAQVWVMNQSIGEGLQQNQTELQQDIEMLRTAKEAGKSYLKKARQVEGYFVDKKK